MPVAKPRREMKHVKRGAPACRCWLSSKNPETNPSLPCPLSMHRTFRTLSLAVLFALRLAAFSQTPPSSAPTSALSATVAGKRVQDYLNSFNSGDDSKMRDFFLNNVPNSALEN